MNYIMENGNTGKKHKDVKSNTNKLIQEPRESNMVDLLLQNQRQSAGYIKDITLWSTYVSLDNKEKNRYFEEKWWLFLPSQVRSSFRTAHIA